MNRSPRRAPAHRQGMFTYPRWVMIAHYYGDTIRMFFIGGTALMLLTAPFYTSNIGVEMPFVIAGAVAFVALAALTNPHNRTIMTLNVIAAASATIVFGGWALIGYQSTSSAVFVLRDAIALVFLFALYFSLKTLRAMYMGQIGREPSENEFTDDGTDAAPVVDDMIEQVVDEEDDSAAKSVPEEEALDGLGNPAAPEVDKGGD